MTASLVTTRGYWLIEDLYRLVRVMDIITDTTPAGRTEVWKASYQHACALIINAWEEYHADGPNPLTREAMPDPCPAHTTARMQLLLADLRLIVLPIQRAATEDWDTVIMPLEWRHLYAQLRSHLRDAWEGGA